MTPEEEKDINEAIVFAEAAGLKLTVERFKLILQELKDEREHANDLVEMLNRIWADPRIAEKERDKILKMLIDHWERRG